MIKKLVIMILSAAALAGCEGGAGDAAKAEQAGNAAYECIMTRTSVRRYQPDRTIPADTVEMLLRAAMAAPTAVNKQPWQYVVVDNRADLDSLAASLPYAKMLSTASIAVVPCVDLGAVIDGETAERGFWIQDVSASTENLLLAAHALSLGAVWTGVYPDTERVALVQKALGMPESIVPLCVVPVGYPEGGVPAPKDKWKPEKVHYNKW